jgi:hypothetical protein
MKNTQQKKKNEMVIVVKIDPSKVAKGHTPHRSGSGPHKNWRIKIRSTEKVELQRDF